MSMKSQSIQHKENFKNRIIAWTIPTLVSAALIIASALALPAPTHAISIFGLEFPPLFVCGDEGMPQCTFYDFFLVFKNLITTMFYLCVPIVFFSFAYAGFKYLTAGDSEDGHTTAKNVFTYTAWGFFWMCAAWIIVRAILEPLLDTAKGFKVLGL